MEFAAIRRASEEAVLRAGGRVCSWLPDPEPVSLRSEVELVDRALVVTAIINLAFGAPISVIADWVKRERLMTALTPWESRLLGGPAEGISREDAHKLQCQIEALWALLWAGQLADVLLIDEFAPDHAATLVPRLERDEDGSKLRKSMRLRAADELAQMRDVYYLAHWSAVDARLTGQESPIEEYIAIERRRALQWVCDTSASWDEPDLST